MFNALLLFRNKSDGPEIEFLASESRKIHILKSLDRYPQAFELTKLVNILNPELAFIDLSHWASALAAAADLRKLAPQLAIIGFGAGVDPQREPELFASGFNELLVSPMALQMFLDGVDRAVHKVTGRIQDNLFAFLPAKAGSGSTTVALNTAAFLAKPLGKKVLLIDADLNSGIIAVLLDLKVGRSLRDALESSSELDSVEWINFTVKAYGVDLLLPDHPRRLPLPSWDNYHHLLDFAARRYDSILVDLPEVINDATVETVRRAKRVFIVCTPELQSLALLPHRTTELTGRGIPKEKIHLVINRWHRGEIGAKDLEEMHHTQVAAVLGNDYRAVSNASAGRGIVSSSTKLGKSFEAFARQLAGKPEEAMAGGCGALSFLKFGKQTVPHA